MKLQKYYLLLGVIILILHGLYFIPADPDARIKNNIFFAGDTAEYYGLASSILAGQGMKSEQWIPVMLRDRYNNFGLNARRTPFYPLFLASIMWTSHLIAPQITHIDIYAILGIQILLMLAASLLFFRLILIITLKPKIAFIATLIISLEPCWFSLQHSIWSENLLLPIVVWHITHVFLYFSRHRKIDFIIIFLSAGFLLLTKPVMAYLHVIVIVCMVIDNNSAPVFFKKKIFNILAGLTILLLFVSPWLVRNKIHFNTWGITSHTGFHYIYYNFYWGGFAPSAEKSAEEFFRLAEQDGVISPDNFNPFVFSSYCLKKGFFLMVKKKLIKYYFRRCITNGFQHFFNVPMYAIFALNNPQLINYALNPNISLISMADLSIYNALHYYWFFFCITFYSLAIAGIIYVVRNYFSNLRNNDTNNRIFYLYIFLVIIYLIAASAPILDARTRLPHMPLIACFFSSGLFFLMKTIHDGN